MDSSPRPLRHFLGPSGTIVGFAAVSQVCGIFKAWLPYSRIYLWDVIINVRLALPGETEPSSAEVRAWQGISRSPAFPCKSGTPMVLSVPGERLFVRDAFLNNHWILEPCLEKPSPCAPRTLPSDEPLRLAADASAASIYSVTASLISDTTAMPLKSNTLELPTTNPDGQLFTQRIEPGDSVRRHPRSRRLVSWRNVAGRHRTRASGRARIPSRRACRRTRPCRALAAFRTQPRWRPTRVTRRE
ncbi:hypothetical protein CA85_15410 [Allorhodopirellula solitaria]|uniref:Uncharacterized protein n=1 Tax=Allorhodopirellula solitaria TaxID=2527987 RepID=A0A5C5YFF8_9BACT|nr:hypothetical protein CA85_15410 [Allorhodopirellula solitaria]